MPRKPHNTGAGATVHDVDETTGDAKVADGVVMDDSIPAGEGENDTRGMLSKLSLSLMGCRPELSLAREQVVMIEGQEQKIKVGKQVLQAVFLGEITNLTGPKELPNAKSEEEKYTYGLAGRIEGINAITGETFRGGVLYLPGGFHDMFLAEVEAGLKAGGNVSIAFALEFHSIPADNPRGYSWKAVNKMPMEKRDPFRELRKRALQGVQIAALPKPGQL